MSNARFCRGLGSGATAMSLILYGLDQMQGKPDHWLIIIAGAAFMMFAIANIYVRN